MLLIVQSPCDGGRSWRFAPQVDDAAVAAMGVVPNVPDPDVVPPIWELNVAVWLAVRAFLRCGKCVIFTRLTVFLVL
jgi:hypothetical protein